MTTQGRNSKIVSPGHKHTYLFLQRHGNVAETLLAKSPKDISIPSITLYELEVGIAKSNSPKKRKKQLES